MVKSSRKHNYYNCHMNIQLQLQLFTISMYLPMLLFAVYIFCRRINTSFIQCVSWNIPGTSCSCHYENNSISYVLKLNIDYIVLLSIKSRWHSCNIKLDITLWQKTYHGALSNIICKIVHYKTFKSMFGTIKSYYVDNIVVVTRVC